MSDHEKWLTASLAQKEERIRALGSVCETLLDRLHVRLQHCRCRSAWLDGSQESFDQHACVDCHRDMRAFERAGKP